MSKIGHDKYYTKMYIANYYSEIVLERYGNAKYIEPTAGNGAFMEVLPDIVGYDLKPEADNIIQSDVFNLKFSTEDIIVGNPPFGMNASLAQKIFNHIASYKVKAICFVLPKTFKKQSMHNKLDLNYHLVFEQDLVNDAFTVNGKNKHVPCVFQIWELNNKPRIKTTPPPCDWIDFVHKDVADVAVRRAGGRAGQLLTGLDHAESSSYFLKVKNKTVIKAIQLINLDVVNNTAGVRSISKSELCAEINKVMGVLDES